MGPWSSGGYSDMGQNGIQTKEVPLSYKERAPYREIHTESARRNDAINRAEPSQMSREVVRRFFGRQQKQKNVEDQLHQWLRLIDKSGPPGKYKAWIYQHCVLSRLMWMMLYEIPTSTAEAMERCVNSFLRRWLGVPPSFTSIGLYSRTLHLAPGLLLV